MTTTLPPARGAPDSLAPTNFAALDYATVPNVITATRTAAAVVLGILAIGQHSTGLLIAAYVCYWIGDMLDGAAARLLKQETRAGAVLDIVGDRTCTSLCAAALLMFRPDMALPLGLFFIQFMLLDTMLSLSFLRWPILSPNYFGQVSRTIYRWNWSPPAKALNTAALILLVLVAPSPVYPTVFALAAIGIKVASLAAVVRLPVPVAQAGPTAPTAR